ncbi:MAG: L-lactate permease [Thermovirgaceae bacterium]
MMFFLAIAPIMVLLSLLLFFRTSAGKAGAASFLSAALVAVTFFGLDIMGLAVSVSKGITLALYVALIITAAIYLYNVVDDLKAVDVIGEHLVHHIRDPLVLFILMAWLFSSFLQGIAGFGVPVAIVAPILVRLGYNPLLSVAAVLLGHSWSISFGSMGSSLFALSLVTSLPARDLAFWMGVYAITALFFTGFGVLWLFGGVSAVRRGSRYVLVGGTGVTLSLFAVIFLGVTSLIGLISTILGIAVFFEYYRRNNNRRPEEPPRNEMGFLEAGLPYILIAFLSIGLQFVPVSIPLLAFDFPAYETGLGFYVKSVSDFAAVKLLRHPAPIIFSCALLSLFYYRRRNLWHEKRFFPVFGITVKRCVPTFVSLVFLVSTATIMMGSGMTEKIALDVASFTGPSYPLFAPFLGILGAFITGSNTNSNVIFGALQQTIAETLNVNSTAMCGVQSIGGSAGCAVGPTQVLLGTSSTGLQGEESLIYKALVIKVLFLGLLLGLANVLLLQLV